MEKLGEQLLESEGQASLETLIVEAPFDEAFFSQGPEITPTMIATMQILEGPRLHTRYQTSYWSNEASRLVDLSQYRDVSELVMARVISHHWGIGSGIEGWSLMATEEGIFGAYVTNQSTDDYIQRSITKILWRETVPGHSVVEDLADIRGEEPVPVSPALFARFLS